MQGIQNSKCTSQVSKPSTFGIQEITRYDLRTFFPKLACSLVSPKRSGLRYAKAISTHHWAAADGLPIRPGKRCRASRFYGTEFVTANDGTVHVMQIICIHCLYHSHYPKHMHFEHPLGTSIYVLLHMVLPLHAYSCWTTPLVTFTAVFCPRTSQCDLSPRTTCVCVCVCLSETYPSL